ncbi:hypothetical protein [Nocardioides sp. SYSU DS0651]|uniref:hypothetical protein n=1 Tax=Nocardioides sp. SYSU DS0651 TaxID=3415955 RepID=UPI003F4B77E9
MSVLTVGVFLLPVALVLAGVGAFWQRLRTTSVVAAIGGLAVAPLYLAWLNRDGPGQVCTTAGDVTECSERWSPWPFLVVGVVLLGIAVVAVARTRGGQSARS